MEHVFLGMPPPTIYRWIMDRRQDMLNARTPLSFYAVADTSIEIKAYGAVMPVDLQYRVDDGEWSMFVPSQTRIELPAGSSASFKAGTANEIFSKYGAYYQFSIPAGEVSCFGNIQSLLDPSLEREDVPEFCFNSLFQNCSTLISPPYMPAKFLQRNCYSNMFYNCRALVSAPRLPATHIAEGCYDCMFGYCTSLVDAPDLPAMAIAPDCYRQMFFGCSSLKTAPRLDAATMFPRCYQYMFYGCSQLSQKIILPATELAGMCYGNMFSNSGVERHQIIANITYDENMHGSFK